MDDSNLARLSRERQQARFERKAERVHKKREQRKQQQIANATQRLARVSKKPRSNKPTPSKFDEFYKTAEWKRVRYDALARSDGRCQLCGRSAHDGVTLNVDHKIPLKVDWTLRLDPKNHQVLCSSCNWGKGNSVGDWEIPAPRMIWCD